MAEALAGLAVASSIIAVIQITSKIVVTGWSYVRTVKGLSKELSQLMVELTSLQGVLAALRDQVATSYTEYDVTGLAVLEILNAPGGAMEACESALQEVDEMFNDFRTSRLSQILVGKTKSKDILSLRDKIERMKSVLTLALYSDHLTLTKGVQDYLYKTLGHVQIEQTAIRYGIEHISQNIDKLCITSEEMAEDQKQSIFDDRSYKTLYWLSSIDYEANHNLACKLQQPGTGLWFLEKIEFLNWLRGPPAPFWLFAIPGAGKTILCSTVIQHLLLSTISSPKVAVTFFYFDFRDVEKQTADGMLCCILHQLSTKLSMVPEEVCALYDIFKGKTARPSTETLLELLATVIRNNFEKVYLVLDALDECTVRQSLLRVIKVLVKTSVVSLFMTSRSEHDIVEEFSLLEIPSMSIQSNEVAMDVELFVSEEIGKTVHLRELESELKSDITQSLVSGANGMFRWVMCQLDSVRQLRRPSAIRKALRTLPRTLDQTYEKILLGVDTSEEREMLRRALQFIVFAVRPVRTEELAEAIIVEADWVQLDKEARFIKVDDIFKGLRSLFLTTEGLVRLSHYSVKEYLRSERAIEGPANFFALMPEESNVEIALTCLTYINLHDFDEGPCVSATQFECRLSNYPFLDYACNYWFIHAQSEAAQSKIGPLFDKIWTDSQAPKYLAWFQTYSDTTITNRRAFDTYKTTDPSILYYPSLWGLHMLCTRLISQKVPVNKQGGYYGNPLQAAAMIVKESIVQMLLDHGAEVNSQGGYYGNALQAAAGSGSKPIVALLIQHGAQVEASGGAYGNALQAASRNGHTDVVELLLEKGADVNGEGGPFGFALQAAANNGHATLVKLLLEKGAAVNAQGGAFGNALQAAALNGRHAVVEILLEHGADANFIGGLYSNSLLAASLNGHESVVRMLLQYGAKPNTQHGAYDNALQAAALNGYEAIVNMLLENGANANIAGGQYTYPLQAASRNGHVAVVRRLIDHGADVNGRGGHYNTALQAASRNGFYEVAELLLVQGALPNLQGGVYGNALQAAASNNKESIVKMLLAHGADINALGGRYHTALHAAAYNGYEKIVRFLLDSGADLGIEGGLYGTAFDAAVAAQRIKVMAVLHEAVLRDRISKPLKAGPSQQLPIPAPVFEQLVGISGAEVKEVDGQSLSETKTDKEELSRIEDMQSKSITASAIEHLTVLEVIGKGETATNENISTNVDAGPTISITDTEVAPTHETVSERLDSPDAVSGVRDNPSDVTAHQGDQEARHGDEALLTTQFVGSEAENETEFPLLA